MNAASGTIDAGHPDTAFDAAHPEQPRTAFGAIVSALAQRRDAESWPFTFQSCDNLRGNGNMTRSTVTSLARRSDPELADWIDSDCNFPNSMVDCIVPATDPNEIAQARALVVEDAAPVTHENCRQWVIEDDFCAGRPNWDQAGATFTDRVLDYETIRIRILNASYQVLANAGELLSVGTTAECMAHPKFHPGLARFSTRNPASCGRSARYDARFLYFVDRDALLKPGDPRYDPSRCV